MATLIADSPLLLHIHLRLLAVSLDLVHFSSLLSRNKSIISGYYYLELGKVRKKKIVLSGRRKLISSSAPSHTQCSLADLSTASWGSFSLVNIFFSIRMIFFCSSRPYFSAISLWDVLPNFQHYVSGMIGKFFGPKLVITAQTLPDLLTEKICCIDLRLLSRCFTSDEGVGMWEDRKDTRTWKLRDSMRMHFVHL